ncbi:MAG: putative outer membrane protein [Herminiimonas sp.]|nr:putative outer membrane protein [Herminiimonas sp.]
MYVQHTLLTSAVLSALAVMSAAAFAQTENKALPEVVVTATPFNANEGAQILAPAKVLSGDELRNKLGSSIGDTLSHELGVSASGFGAGASRPIIRGLEGPRVKILQNGMSVSDVSGLSNDHAVATEASTARQIEILRGPAALLYGSGAIGGLVNIVNDRIPTVLEAKPTGEAEVRYGTVDKAKSLSLSADGSAGPIGLHVDSNSRHADDYGIPGFKVLNDPTSASGTLPLSYTRESSLGVGASYISGWGHIGASVGTLDNRYGIPTTAGSQIDQSQTRYDIDALVREPFAAFETFKFKLGYTDYKHTELDLTDVPQTNFSNKTLETRWELTHKPLAGWHGTFGVQTEDTKFSALSAGTGGPDTVPVTKSSSVAGFIVEERDFGPVRMNAGLRLESTKRRPVTGQDRSFDLASYTAGGLWAFMPGYGLGATASVAQRAPAIEELYSGGPHDATGTFDKGNPDLQKETSRNIELTLQKTEGLVRWKTNVFENHVKHFIFGQITGNKLDDNGDIGGDFNERIFSQADATIRGAEAEISYNLRGEGGSLRGFADTSRGRLDNAGNLPLQPATRFGIEAGYKQGPWRSGMTLLHAQGQDRLASFETTETPAYTQLDANLSYTQRYGTYQVTWFAIAKNLLNQDIRLSTSVLKDVAPLPGRNLIIGARTMF